MTKIPNCSPVYCSFCLFPMYKCFRTTNMYMYNHVASGENFYFKSRIPRKKNFWFPTRMPKRTTRFYNTLLFLFGYNHKNILYWPPSLFHFFWGVDHSFLYIAWTIPDHYFSPLSSTQQNFIETQFFAFLNIQICLPYVHLVPLIHHSDMFSVQLTFLYKPYICICTNIIFFCMHICD